MVKIELPVVVVNFKTYPQATGEKAVALAKTCEKVSNESGVSVVVAPQIPDIHRISLAVDIPVFTSSLLQVHFVGKILQKGYADQ